MSSKFYKFVWCTTDQWYNILCYERIFWTVKKWEVNGGYCNNHNSYKWHWEVISKEIFNLLVNYVHLYKDIRHWELNETPLHAHIMHEKLALHNRHLHLWSNSRLTIRRIWQRTLKKNVKWIKFETKSFHFEKLILCAFQLRPSQYTIYYFFRGFLTITMTMNLFS